MNKGRSLGQKFFTEFFPPPRFLEMPSVGLDISDECIRFAELKNDGDHFSIGIFGEEKVPKDVIEEGYVKNKDALKQILADLRKKHNLYFVRASLPEEKSYLFRTEIPYMDEADIRSTLRYKIEENVPISLNDAVFDYRYIKEPKSGDSKIEIGVAVIHKKVVGSYLDVLYGAGLMPLKMRIESQAIAHAIIPENDPSAVIIVAVQENKTILAIVSQNIIQFSSTLPISGKLINTSIQKNFSVSEEQAQDIRKGKDIRERDELIISFMNSASVIRDEIQKLLAYWDTHGDQENKKIQKILLCGSDAMLGFHEYLNHSFPIPAEIANVWSNILSVEDHLPQITHRDSLNYASALGLALPYD